MHLDGATLLMVELMLSGIGFILWLITAIIFKSSPKSAIQYAIANICIGTCVFAYFYRVPNPSTANIWFSFVFSDFSLIVSMFFVRRGIEEFIETKKSDKIQIATGLLVMLIDIYARFTPGRSSVSVFIISLFSSVTLFYATRKAYVYMLKDFERKIVLLTLSPVFLMSIFFGSRFIMAFIIPHQNTDLRQNSSFIVIFIISMIIGILGFNGSTLGLVISHLISQISRLSIEDSLTQTFNRRHINQVAQDTINKMNQGGKGFSIIMLDIDHFKKVNDSYGHGAGDQVLISCSQTLKDSVRETDYVGRLGGEEFCIILPETTVEEASVLAERIRIKIENIEVYWESITIKITASFGISSLSQKDEWSALLNKADLAMYKAKNNGRNQVVIDK